MANTLIEEIYASRKVLDADGAPRDAFPASLPYPDGKALHTAITETKSLRTLEIGMAYGVSTLFMLQGLDENGGGAHTAIDPYQQRWWEGIGRLNVARGGYKSTFQCIEAPSFEALPRLVSEGQKYDFIFLDGNHRFEFTLVDFFYADKLLNVGGWVMLHDVWLPSIRKIVSYISRNERGYYVVDPTFNGPPCRGLSFWRLYLQTLRSAPFDLLPAYFYAMRRYQRYCVLQKKQEHNPEELDADWNYYRPF